MSEPCPRCERDYTTAQAMKSYIDAATLAGDAAIERDKALAAIKRVHVLLDNCCNVFVDVEGVRMALRLTP